ncbi:hypothetical protein AX15_007038 [Amanita polypyramis BW_CC]|nr:hypothetical protein AX15_007038 [Amanita polypyramis BW_CC]
MSSPITNNSNPQAASTSTPLSAPRAQLQHRRMTSPAEMTRSSLALPDTSVPKPSNVRPPSPLRNAFVPSTFTGIHPDGNDSDDDSEDDINNKIYDQDKRNSNYPYQQSSPTSSVSQLAVNLAQRVGNFVAGNLPAHASSTASGTRLPTDAEIVAEAHREREQSRREAERILTREAEERKKAEENLFGLKEMADPLHPPPSRLQIMSNPPSPSSSPKSRESWWVAAKNRLTPTKEKEPLTPAQQVILEAKAREKEKNTKGNEKENKEWPANPQAKLNDSAMLNLAVPPAVPTRPVPTSPVSPTPSRTQAPNLTPSSMRSSNGASSPSKDSLPLYTQFTPQGTLDVHGTLLTVARRFEKLEKWTVGHVRALEERMNDVERWLVEKEKEKEGKSQKDSSPISTGHELSAVPSASHDLNEIREELAELQGRVGVLGREMARMGTRYSPTSASSSLPPSRMGSAFTTPHQPRRPSATARESTSPPMASIKPTGTRLPYPTGDYASPSDNLFSPNHSPPSSVNSATWSRPIAIPATSGNGATATATGLGGGLSSSTSLSTSYSSASFSTVSSISSRPLPASPKLASHSASSSIARVASPTPMSSQQVSTLSLPPPPKLPSSASGSPSGGKRQTSVSPTPRKRYTVALGEPIVPREPQVQDSPPSAPLKRRTHSRNQSVVSTASFTGMVAGGGSGKKDGATEGDESARESGDGSEHGDEIGDQFADETIGKSAASKIVGVSFGLGLGATNGAGGGSGSSTNTSGAVGNGNGEPSSNEKTKSPSPRSRRRVRPQSAYDFTSFLNQQQQQLQQRSSQQSFQSQSTQSSQGSSLIAPLRPRWRSQSTDRGDGGGSSCGGIVGRGGNGGESGARASRFIDPLVMRKQGRELTTKLPMPKSIGKVPVGELVAFFDGEKKEKS